MAGVSFVIHNRPFLTMPPDSSGPPDSFKGGAGHTDYRVWNSHSISLGGQRVETELKHVASDLLRPH